MITTRHMTLEMELVRWMLLIIAAIILALAIATVAAAADPMGPPQLLPDDMGELAKPMPQVDPVRPYFPEVPADDLPPAAMAARLWTVLEEHRAGQFAAAIAGWEQIHLPYATAHYRQLALGEAYLQAGDLQHAEMHLAMARQMKPGHALVAYFTGLLRLEQAAAAGRAPDGWDRGAKLVGHLPNKEKALYEQMAMTELRDAIGRADELRVDERLMPGDMETEEAVIVPCVGDLMVALKAENFVGKAHLALFGLLLDRGELIVAETHLDAAADMGLATLYGYQDLATMHLALDRHADAMRVLNKDLAHNHPWVGRTCRWLETLAEDAGRQWWVW
jgi:tetratricopeptide (TPR) repeat protein